MGTRQVSIRADEGLFLGLAKQNMLFHQCIFELCDNAIAAAVDGRKPNIDIFLNQLLMTQTKLMFGCVTTEEEWTISS